MSDDKLTKALISVAGEEIKIPNKLSEKTTDIILAAEPVEVKTFPYIVALVFLANIFISLLFGGILFLMRPITLFEWIIIGSIYSTVNVFLYAVTFMNYEKFKDMLSAYSKGGL